MTDANTGTISVPVSARARKSSKGQSENFRLANFDNLTVLPIARQFFTHLEQTFAEPACADSPLAIVISTSSSWSMISTGTRSADELWVEVGAAPGGADGGIRASPGLGGDEFALNVADCPGRWRTA